MTNAPLTLDYANCLADRVGGHGVHAEEFAAAQQHLAAVTEDLERTRGTGWERWRSLPFSPMRDEHVRAVRTLVDSLRPRTENLLVLGIGGSALGNIALQAALNPLTWNLLPREKRNGPRLFVLDNVDPTFVGDVMDVIESSDPKFERTVINVISKSGETAETAAQFLIAQEKLKRARGDRHADHIVAVTDPAKGTMRSICDQEGYATLPVPDGVGGRFSVLSPVGLFSAAMCGIDIAALLDGALAMDARCSRATMRENPAATLAWLLVTFAQRGKSNHVLMPYANGLYLLADWYRQLWAESLGKQHDLEGREVFAGATPIKALGTTDQHSQVQLYREGPNDKVIGFLEVDHFSRDLRVPDAISTESLQYLAGASMSNLLNAEKRATEFALLESKRPNFTLQFPAVNAHTVGQFIQLWQVTTAYAGRLLNIDAYDQPAVETGKVATFGLMGRSEYESWKTDVEARLQSTAARIEE